MGERRNAGLTFGQLITLTFGFLLASVVIFVFGFWIGRDLAEQQATKQREVAHIPVAPPLPEPTHVVAVAEPNRPVEANRPAESTRAVAVPATRAPIVVAAAPTNTATAIPTMTARPPATATRERAAAVTPTVVVGTWTVQAYATNDMMRAVMLSKTLQNKGYAASTATKQVGGVTWYLVRVGKYRDRASAKAMESKLRSEEGLEAASVTAQ